MLNSWVVAVLSVVWSTILPLGVDLMPLVNVEPVKMGEPSLEVNIIFILPLFAC